MKYQYKLLILISILSILQSCKEDEPIMSE
ncbi:MAG: hypothetical protein ACI97N_002290, partial [Cognaticolwellia sp.]